MNHAKYPGRVNNSIDYYDKGMLIAFGIDARLRFGKDSAKYTSLDDAFRAFYFEFFGKEDKVPADYVGYTTDDAIQFFKKVQAGLGGAIDKLLNKAKNLDTEVQFKTIGFDVKYENTQYLGLFFMNDGAPTIYGVGDTSPAGKVGIAALDVIQTVNGYAYSQKGLEWAARQKSPVDLEVLRGHRRLKFTIKPRPFKKLKNLIWNGTDAQAKRISNWLDSGFNPMQGDVFSLDFYDNFHGNESLV